jgi:transcriptional regulator with XRE-family HTH domain
MSQTICKYHNRLRKFRRLMRYKQKDVAKKIGLKSPNRISRWENGTALPSVVNLFKLSVLYHTLADQLYIDLVEDLRDEILSNGHTNHYERQFK